MDTFELTHKFKLSAKKEKLLSEAPTNPLGRKTALSYIGKSGQRDKFTSPVYRL